MKSNNDYPVVVKSYELTLWYIQKLSTLPKNHRFTLGEQIHPLKIGFGSCCEGFEMLGHKVYSTYIRLSSKSIKRSKTRLINIRHLYHNDKLTLPQAKSKIFGTVGFMKIGDNYRLTDILLAETLLTKKPLEAVPPWR